MPVNFGHTVEGGRHALLPRRRGGAQVDLVRRNGWAGFELEPATGLGRRRPVATPPRFKRHRRGPHPRVRRRKRSGGVWRHHAPGYLLRGLEHPDAAVDAVASCADADILLQGAPIIRLGGDGMRRIWLGFA
ncbi:MAG: hypothetical protein ACLTYN_05025 [Dysosmobacter welbionis]